MLWLSFILAAVAGAAAAFAFVAASSAARWRTRAKTAEALLDRAAARRSDASARGNSTRKAEDRSRFFATAEKLDPATMARVRADIQGGRA